MWAAVGADYIIRKNKRAQKNVKEEESVISYLP